MKGSPHANIDGSFESLEVGFVEEFAVAVGSIGDQDIDVPVLADEITNEFIYGIPLGDVNDSRLTAAAACANSREGILRWPDIIDHNVRSGLGQVQSACSANATPGTCHDSDSA